MRRVGVVLNTHTHTHTQRERERERMANNSVHAWAKDSAVHSREAKCPC